jgi:predicted TIM-barrel fold metal-dependent hydrolase
LRLSTTQIDFEPRGLSLGVGSVPAGLEASEPLSGTGGYRPKYFVVPGTGWEPLLQYGQTTIQDKILYGTGTFLLGRRPAELLQEFDALPPPPPIREKWLWGNAAKLLNLGNN